MVLVGCLTLIAERNNLMLNISLLDRYVIFAGNGSTALLAVIDSAPGPAWLTAGGTVFYLICKGVAEVIKAKRKGDS